MPPINACCVCMVLRRSARVVEKWKLLKKFQGTRLVGIVEAPHLHQFQQLRFDWIELLSFLSSITSILEVLLYHWSSDLRSLLSTALDFQSLRLLNLLIVPQGLFSIGSITSLNTAISPTSRDRAARLSQHPMLINQSCRWLKRFVLSLRRKSDLSSKCQSLHAQCVGGSIKQVCLVELLVTQENVSQRLAFVSNYSGWNESQWNTVLFSDETHVILGGNGQVWVQRPEDTAFLSQFMTERYPFPEKISLWGCFSAQGIGASRVFDGTMNSRLLTDTFMRYMKPHALQTWPAQQWYFLQDNAPYHTSNQSRAWLHNNGIDCIDFPPYSPDLNPIENLWADLKRRVELRCPCDSTELKQFLTEEWTATDPEYLRCLAHSMIDRCKAVAACRGFKTKYWHIESLSSTSSDDEVPAIKDEKHLLLSMAVWTKVNVYRETGEVS